MSKAQRNMFHALQILPEPAPRHIAATTAKRVDIGWGAWRSNAGLTSASLGAKARFWLALWRHFGHAQFLVQVDNSYHTATSLRLRQSEDQRHIEVLLIQTASLSQCLRGLLQKRLKQPPPVWRKLLQGQTVLISRYPNDTLDALLPTLPAHGFGPCHEVLLDSQVAAQLPLRITLG